MIPTSDGGTIILSVHGSQFTVLTKVDCFGNILWNRSWELAAITHPFDGGLLETEDGHILVTFPMKFQNLPLQKFNIGTMKLDANGNVIWKNQYGSDLYTEFSTSIIETSDKGYLMIGGIYKEFDNPFNEFYFFKIDSMGTPLWTKSFGEDEFDNHISASMKDQDGNIILVGTNSGYMPYQWKGIIIKISPTGNIIFYKEIKNISHLTAIRSITSTSNGDYLLTGHYSNPDSITYSSFILKINSVGDLLDAKKISTSSKIESFGSYSIISLLNGGYAIAGSAIGFPEYTSNTEFGDLAFICMLNESEEYIGSKIYNHNGIASNFDAFYFKARPDGDYNLSFTRISAGDSHLPLKIEYMRLDKNFSSGCNDYDASEDFSLTSLQGWILEDNNFTTSASGERFDFLHPTENHLPDSILTICVSELQANFLLENICPSIPITFDNQSAGPITFREWNFNNGQFISNEKNPTYTFTESGFFPLQLVVSDGCRMDTIVQEIEVEGEPCTCNAIFPNAFTPDQDGLNDFFHPVIDCDYPIENYNLMLFNRWGQLIFKTDNLEEKWDGTFKGKPVPTDVLVYKVQYDVIDWNGILIRQTKESGDVTLIR